MKLREHFPFLNPDLDAWDRIESLGAWVIGCAFVGAWLYFLVMILVYVVAGVSLPHPFGDSVGGY